MCTIMRTSNLVCACVCMYVCIMLVYFKTYGLVLLNSCDKPSIQYAGFEVLTAVVMKSTVFWDITPYSSLNVNQRFGGTYCLHLQGQRISWARSQHESRWQAEALLVSCLAYSSTLKMEPICSFRTLVDIHQTTWDYIPRRYCSFCKVNLQHSFFTIKIINSVLWMSFHRIFL
jgi:hypothetical protein